MTGRFKIVSIAAVGAVAAVFVGASLMADDTVQEIELTVAEDFCGRMTVFTLPETLWDLSPDAPMTGRVAVGTAPGIILRDEGAPGNVTLRFVTSDGTPVDQGATLSATFHPGPLQVQTDGTQVTDTDGPTVMATSFALGAEDACGAPTPASLSDLFDELLGP